MSRKCVHVFVSGIVQGVWFRENTRMQAEALGVRGWVRNLVDGRVEGVFEGDAPAVDRLVRWCHEGPEAARVTGVEVREEGAAGGFSGFRIER